jgi:hypothetical protein
MNISGNSSKVLDDFLRALRLSSTGFASVVLSVQKKDRLEWKTYVIRML